MKLEELIDNNTTDINTIHSYLEIYEELFHSKKETSKNILEIGVGEGGSIKLWDDYFTNGTIYGIDFRENSCWDELKKREKVKLFTNNPYDYNFIKNEFIDKNIKFDIIIDDGPHTLESMMFFAMHYSQLLEEGGVLIIEDIQSPEWIPFICNNFPAKYKDNDKINIIDLRSKKFRYDDLLIICKN